MKDYEKHLDNGAVLAKRGYCYFIYESEVALQNDDYEVGRNIERINAGVPVFNRCEVGSWFAMSRKMKDIMNCYNECFKRRKTMEMIRIYNRKTGEILEKTFSNSEDADSYEDILDFLMAEYERYHNGEMICASEGEEKFMLKCSDDDYEGEPYEDVVDDYDGWDDEEEDY